MKDISNTIAKLEMAQIAWVVPDIRAAVKFLSGSLAVTGFPPPAHMHAEELQMTYYDEVVPADWLTTQTYNGLFIELIQPLSGQSMFHDYLERYPAGGIQHIAYRLPESGFQQVIDEFTTQGLTLLSKVDHPIARMKFFDTYPTLGVATEIMGITPEGWKALESMERKK